MKQKQRSSSVMLMITALIWGAAFVAQSVGMDYVGPFTFNAMRFLIGGIVLIPCICLLKRFNTQDSEAVSQEDKRKKRSVGVIGGICCGIVICIASVLQQIGVSHTTVGKAGFITSLYIIIVPLLSVFLKKKAGLNIWLSVLIALVGMYLLCMSDGLSIGKGDFFVFLCSIAFSFHILVIDYFAPKADGVRMSCIQFLTAGVLSAAAMFVFEKPQIASILAAWAPILYAGVLSCGVGYTMQVIAQKDIEPTIASLIMSLESVFSLLAGWLLLGQVLSAKELLGCMLVFFAIILAQIPAVVWSRRMPRISNQ